MCESDKPGANVGMANRSRSLENPFCAGMSCVLVIAPSGTTTLLHDFEPMHPIDKNDAQPPPPPTWRQSKRKRLCLHLLQFHPALRAAEDAVYQAEDEHSQGVLA